MRILSFHSGPHDSSAAVYEDYSCIAAVQEERLTRAKSSGGLPWLAIDEVLGIAGWSRRDVDAIATTRSIFPMAYIRNTPGREIYYALRRALGEDLSLREVSLACQRQGRTDAAAIFKSAQFLRDQAFRPTIPIYFANHHEAHGLPALFYTDWDEGLVYTADGVGDNVSYSIRSLKGGELSCHYGDDSWLLRQRASKDSVAMAYGFATNACGFQRGRHEGKLTGLAAHGKPELVDAFLRHYRLGADGLIRSDFRSWKKMDRRVMEICRGHDQASIAASVQEMAERLVCGSVGHWLQRTGTRRLALAGGLFSNVRLNRLLAETLPLDEIFIFPAMGDEGLSMGAALCLLRDRDGVAEWLSQRRRLDHVYLGRAFDERVDACLTGVAGVVRKTGAPADLAVELIRAGKVGAIYTGRTEFGPRALGARSIIASPRDRAVNDELNRRLSRSDFMPFAPYVLEEDAERVFEITPRTRYAARFMTIACAVRPEWHQRIPGVIHIDGSARPQIIRDADNPLFAAILRKFRDATGLPVLINTSFNVHEEPIVHRPEECARALGDGRIDFVVTANAVYLRQAAKAAVGAELADAFA